MDPRALPATFLYLDILLFHGTLLLAEMGSSERAQMCAHLDFVNFAAILPRKVTREQRLIVWLASERRVLALRLNAVKIVHRVHRRSRSSRARQLLSAHL
ncbi:hypothetical protein OE88DRAFT_1279049 [Heliocybe sulcata]|uniref:Transposase InsH N-terminal domain-containing protein n=1 Tax=Heliocybe sulcata TaxID=5364 RepID=A0A5C3NA81_9AGAM|nr:hypothetical protein OE88DRAFT_1279049 [Heliocybe sulcata]